VDSEQITVSRHVANLLTSRHTSSAVSEITLAEDDEDLGQSKQRSIAKYSRRHSTIDLDVGCDSYAYMENAPWGQYVAGLDADMIPMPHWLRALVPHIEDDADCAMVCPPQVRKSLQREKTAGHDKLTLSSRHFTTFPLMIL
jgi:hypothetical protein